MMMYSGKCENGFPFRRARLGVVLTAGFVLSTILSAGADELGTAAQKPTPINEAEAIIEPFWDPNLSGLSQWSIADGRGHGLSVKQTWASVEFCWTSKPAVGPALSMARRFDVDCSGYDRLLVAAVLPVGSVLRVVADTDKGMREYVSPPVPKEIVEHTLALDGATRIAALTIELVTEAQGPAAGWFTWIGLQNVELLTRYLDRWDFSGVKWDAYLKNEAYEPQFKPQYGIFLAQDALEGFRAEHQASMDKDGRSSYSERAASLRAMQPERGIHEFAWSGSGRNAPHGRTRDESMTPLRGGYDAALAGLVLKDKELLRMAARCALALAMCDKWDNGFLARFPGSSWELRSFRRSYCSEDMAKTLDLAGEMLTDAGRTYAMRRLAEEGIGPVNYITWRFDYLFHGNQLGFVTRGRLAAYLVMEREWPHVRPYTDIAYRNVLEMFDNVILSDGGCLEPPTYVGSTFGRGCEMLGMYARARGLDPRSTLPQSLRRTGNYAAAIASTVPGADVIPYGDSGTLLKKDTLFRLADLAPKSYWTAMLRKGLERETQMAFSAEEARTLASLPDRTPKAPSFIALPDTGHMASTRFIKASNGDRLPVKIFILGNRAGDTHDHEHEDRGSFVLEFAGETFAMDPGICEYEDPLQALMKQCQYHNMLVPVGIPERPSPECPIRAAVMPRGHGNRTSFCASIDATPGWGRYYKQWRRTWHSPAPDVLTIDDDYELVKGDGVEFCLQTTLSVRVDGQQVVLHGTRGTLLLEAPADCSIRIDTLPNPEKTVHSRITVRRPVASGRLCMTIRLAAQ